MKKSIVVHLDKKEIERTVKNGADELYMEEEMNSIEMILRKRIKILKQTIDIQQQIINTYKKMLQEAQNGR